MYAHFELKIQRLICTQQERPLFKPLNFIVKNQQILLLHGSNGVGKTTCLRTLAGLLQPAQGEIYWNNKIMVPYNVDYLQHITYLGHHSGIKLALTPTENLQLYLTLINQEKNIFNIPAILAQMNLSTLSQIPCANLSAGQQRRVALARLLIAELPLWILDEPLTALDAQGILLFEKLLTQHTAKGGAAILTSHQYFTDASQTIEVEPW